jgi:transcriptional regulator with XRE-family HTH domain
MSIGSRIRALRDRHKITQADLAKRLGVQPQSVSQWERDVTRPETQRARELAVIFDVPLDWLLNDEDGPVSGESLPATSTDLGFARFDPRILQSVLSAALHALAMSRETADKMAAELLQIARLPPDPSVPASPEDQARLRAATVIGLRHS